ncbi:MAG: IPT/TIG domain-containing protein [Tannerella sp.]|jgi:hypothetical protein|nr:IPT/TIG domain-containing protein [Tannerella sp.]
MKIIKYIQVFVLIASLPLLAGCDYNEDDITFSENYDVQWVVSKITGVTPLEGAAGTQITITGENLGTKYVQADGFKIGADACTIVSQSETQVVVIAPNFLQTEPAEISVYNLHNRTFVYEQLFTPVVGD